MRQSPSYISRLFLACILVFVGLSLLACGPGAGPGLEDESEDQAGTPIAVETEPTTEAAPTETPQPTPTPALDEIDGLSAYYPAESDDESDDQAEQLAVIQDGLFELALQGVNWAAEGVRPLVVVRDQVDDAAEKAPSQGSALEGVEAEGGSPDETQTASQDLDDRLVVVLAVDSRQESDIGPGVWIASADAEGESALALYAPLPAEYDAETDEIVGEFLLDGAFTLMARPIQPEQDHAGKINTDEYQIWDPTLGSGVWRELMGQEPTLVKLASVDFARPLESPEIMDEDPNGLFPRTFQMTYDYEVAVGDGSGRTINNSITIALDKTVTEHPEVPAIGFRINTEYHDPEETVNLLGRCILEMHYHSWREDNPDSPLDFEGYLSLVADGGGQYTFKGSQESPDYGYDSDEFRTFRVVEADPSKPLTVVMSHERRGNPAYQGARSFRTSYWPVVRTDGSIEVRVQFDDKAKNTKSMFRDEYLAPYRFGLVAVDSITGAGYAFSYPEELVDVGPDGGGVQLSVNTDVRDSTNPFYATSVETVDQVPFMGILP